MSSIHPIVDGDSKMSRLYDKIQKQKKIVAEKQEELDIAESTLQALEFKALKYKSKKTRKAHRKKLINDPTYAMICRMNKEIFKPRPMVTEHSKPINLPMFHGMDAQLRLDKEEDNSFFTKFVREHFYRRFKK